MNEHDAFLAEIIANPDDDTPRLVYADWLDEQGDPRGEFIRVQCALAQLGADTSRPALLGREKALLREHRAEWCKPFGVQVTRIRRGFVEGLQLPGDVLVKEATRLFDAAPIQRLDIEMNDKVAAEVAALPQFERVRELGFPQVSPASNEFVQLLAANPHCRNLRRLALWNKGLNNDSAIAIANSAHFSQLQRLDLSTNYIGNAGALALMQSAYLAGIERLLLYNNPIGEEVRWQLMDHFGRRVAL